MSLPTASAWQNPAQAAEISKALALVAPRPWAISTASAGIWVRWWWWPTTTEPMSAGSIPAFASALAAAAIPIAATVSLGSGVSAGPDAGPLLDPFGVEPCLLPDIFVIDDAHGTVRTDPIYAGIARLRHFRLDRHQHVLSKPRDMSIALAAQGRIEDDRNGYPLHRLSSGHQDPLLTVKACGATFSGFWLSSAAARWPACS